MDELRDNEERLREAILEVTLLREREALALRESNALLDGLGRMTRASTPGEAVTDLLASARDSLACDLTCVVASDEGRAVIVEATHPELAHSCMPSDLIQRDRARRIADLVRVDWWAGADPRLREMRAVLTAPIDLPSGTRGALVGFSRKRDHFSLADQSLIMRLSALASQALAALALSERNALLAAVIEGASASVAIADATSEDTPLIYVNRAFLELSAYTREEVLGKNCRFLSAESNDEPERTRLRNTIANSGSGTFELLNRRRTGELFWNRLTLYPVRDEAGMSRYLVATQVDITAERAAAAERDDARRQLVGALSSTSEGFLLLDAQDVVVFANDQFRDFFETETARWQEGVDFVEAWTNRMLDLGHSFDEAKRLALQRRDGLYSGQRDHEERLHDGRILLINDRPTANGGAVSIATDVTNLKATEKALAQRAVAIDAAQDGIAVTDEAGRFVYINPSHLQMFGYTDEAEILGRHWSLLYRADQTEFINRVAMAELERAGTWRGEVSGLSKAGTTVTQEVSLTLLRGVGLVCVTRDISERQRNERERGRLREQLHEAQRQEAIGQLAAGVAHDFNNVLAAITGSAALLRLELSENHSGRVHADRIVAAGGRAADLVNRLIRRGERRPERGKIDLCGLVFEATELLRAGLPSQITLRVSCPSGRIIADAHGTDVLQVLLNLGINARDAICGEGEICVGLERTTLAVAPADLHIGTIETDREYALIRVQDTGSGIATEMSEEIFRPYFSTKGADGTGLGLAIVSSIIKAVGGAVGVSSPPTGGTEFCVYWPLTEGAPARSIGQIHKAQCTEAADNSAGAALNDCTVIICDDAEPVAQVIAAVLEQAGAETAICCDPRDALEAVREDPDAWALLVTDFDMPHMSGAELGTAVRSVVPEMPILLCTALSEHHRTDAPFDAVVPKPIEPDSLIALAGTAINARNRKANG